MLKTIGNQPTHSKITSILTRLRREWQQATDGASLIETDGNIGLVLADLINAFGLDAEEGYQILGNDLYLELVDLLHAPPHC